MTTPRPYHQPMSVEAALDELVRCSGSQFDPEVVAPLVALIRAGFDARASPGAPVSVDRSSFTDS
jgi:HD-GYP domain-containing protein (c-di-GMP phosphodiesterase class II)